MVADLWDNEVEKVIVPEAALFCSSTMNKDRFCNTMASVALVHTSIQSD